MITLAAWAFRSFFRKFDFRGHFCIFNLHRRVLKQDFSKVSQNNSIKFYTMPIRENLISGLVFCLQNIGWGQVYEIIKNNMQLSFHTFINIVLRKQY